MPIENPFDPHRIDTAQFGLPVEYKQYFDSALEHLQRAYREGRASVAKEYHDRANEAQRHYAEEIMRLEAQVATLKQELADAWKEIHAVNEPPKDRRDPDYH